MRRAALAFLCFLTVPSAHAADLQQVAAVEMGRRAGEFVGLIDACWPEKMTPGRSKLAILQTFEQHGYRGDRLDEIALAVDQGRMIAISMPCTKQSYDLAAKRFTEASTAHEQVVQKKLSKR